MLASRPGRPGPVRRAGETFDVVHDAPGRRPSGTSARCQSEEDDVLTALLVSLGVIFVAELGDKSQLMALTFATRYPAVPVLIGITAATALVHAVSVLVGGLLGATLPTRLITLVAALAFVAFGIWTLRGDRLTDEDERRAARPTHHIALTVGVVFFLAELGDKTMLATIALATREGLLGTWIGSTVGMVVADGVAIGVGRLLGTRLPERAVRIGAAVSFFVFAGLLLIDAAQG
jgi:putative Ca2+/H+ antiporter (TMEM165/GDT1 family)